MSPGMGKLQLGGHMRAINLFNLARYAGIDYINNPY